PVVHHRHEEQQAHPRRRSGIHGPAQRHAHADPQERQRPNDERRPEPGGRVPQQLRAQDPHGVDIRERRPQAMGDRPHDRDIDPVLEQHQPGAVQQVAATIDRLAEGEPEAQPAPPPHAFASSSSFFRTSATFCAASGGTSWYTWNFERYVPRPCVIECNVVAYRSSSASGTSALTLTRRPSGSVPRIWPRRDDRSPITAPWKSSGVDTSSSRIGSSSTGRQFGLTFRNARIPAILNDISFESTSW